MHSLLKDSSELPSSAHQVISNDDLLTEILLRLPPFSLRAFKKYVSKRWSTLITNPNFTLRRSQNPIPDLPSGLIIQRNCTSYEYDFVPLDYQIQASKFTFDVNSSHNNKVEILQSCNGLLLCRNIMSNELCVYNTLIKQFYLIDTSPLGVGQSLYSPSCGLRMAFDPSKSPYHYKIIYAREIKNDDHGSWIQLHVYSSVTRSWSVFVDRSFSLKGFNNGIYWNDGIHWLDGVNLLKLDVEHLTLTKIETPEKTYNWKLFESEGCLLLLCIQLVSYANKDQWLNIYEMNKSDSGWSCKCWVELAGIKASIPKTRRESREWFFSSVRCIVMVNDYSIGFLVMELYGKIMHYPIYSMEIRKLYELVSDNSSVSFVYMAPFASITK